MNSDFKAELDQILTSCRTKENWGNDDRQVLKAFREKLGTPTEVAHALEVSVATLYAWEKHESKGNELRPPPPEKQLKKLSRVIAKNHLDSLVNPSSPPDSLKADLYDVLVRMRSVEEMMKRTAMCDEFWVMRSGRPFVAGTDEKTLKLTLDFVSGNETEYYFVYVDPAESSNRDYRSSRAMESFNSFYKKLTDPSRAVPSSIISRIHGVRVPTDQAIQLGLCDAWISYAMAEYSSEGRETFQRSVDVWVEFVFDVSKNSQKDEKQLVWLELPADEAERWRERRASFLQDARKSAKDKAKKSA